MTQVEFAKAAKHEEPVSGAARALLQPPLDDVLKYLKLSARRSKDDIEYIHRLRVATRRGQAGLSVFSDVLPPGRTQRLQKHLKRLRQIAGEARDLDVLILRFRDLAHGVPDLSIRAIIDRLDRQRRAAQRPVVATWKQARQLKWPAEFKKELRKIRWRGEGAEPGLAQHARNQLGPIIQRFLDAGQQDLSQIENLHDLRKNGKRLRYRLELLGGALASSVQDELQSELRSFQDRLGAINDHATAQQVFERLETEFADPAVKARLAELARQEAELFRRECEGFLSRWETRSIERLRSRFDILLGDTTLAEDTQTRSNRIQAKPATGRNVITCN